MTPKAHDDGRSSRGSGGDHHRSGGHSSYDRYYDSVPGMSLLPPPRREGIVVDAVEWNAQEISGIPKVVSNV